MNDLLQRIAKDAETLKVRYRRAHAKNDRAEMAACVADLERLEQEHKFLTDDPPNQLAAERGRGRRSPGRRP